MAIGPRLELRQTQSLVMTPQLQQAIKLLQFSNLDVTAFVEQELERNPLLERDEATPAPAEAGEPSTPEPSPSAGDTAELVASDSLPEPDADPFDGGFDGYEAWGAADGMGGSAAAAADGGADDWTERLETRPSLREHLGEQLRLMTDDPAERMIGSHLIALLDGAGRLEADPEAVAAALGVDLACVERVRGRMMGFDPAGLFARSLAECLAAQLRERNRLDPAMEALLGHLDLLAARNWAKLGEICGVDRDDLADMAAELRTLDPKPGAGWSEELVAPLVPDVLMRPAPAGGGWTLELNSETLPKLLVREGFAASIGTRARETRKFVSDNLASAHWLLRALQQRSETILKVAAEIVERQDGFFRHGVSHLRPLTLREVADTVGLHESTVSRVTSNKYMATPRGTLELKYFFSVAIAGAGGTESHSAEAVRWKIRSLIEGEPAGSPLSDDALVAALRREGVDIARRTIAKYREAMRIPSSLERRRAAAAMTA